MTANEDEDAETKGLSLGAMDFIRKPFVANVLVLRVKHAVELIRLQRDLEGMVEEKTRENENLFMHVVESLADAYDAMASNRSYRGALPQEVVRSEIEKGKGNQFDPTFADIMLEMIDEDKDYLMRDKPNK